MYEKFLVRTLTTIVLLIILAIPATDAQTITFGEWATNQGWPAGYAMPFSVSANSASIDSLAGLPDYNWTAKLTRFLYLNNNQITSLESGAFTGLDSLMYLYLDFNLISNIDSGAFTGLGSLRLLDLSSNQITSLESVDFTGLDRLGNLRLGDNDITCIEAGAFNGLNLQFLDLSNNQITSIEAGAFNGQRIVGLFLGDNTALTELNLEGVDFSRLMYFDLTNNNEIARVSLRNTILNRDALKALFIGDPIGIGELPAVTELDLSGIDFSHISSHLVYLFGMDNLTDLWLVEVKNIYPIELRFLLDNLEAMEDPSIEGTLYMTQADFDVINTTGGGLLAAWDAEPGHHVEIVIPEPASIVLLLALTAFTIARCRTSRN